ncbi:uncharacterized protein F4812DRAFT_470562 [Daldinia caldariorum]|uniref:uncharacterized protein n=1 Tax=Daldinia caldariorum TaxID=326644 RepID=UPI002008305B|nr:uncharacterized protein F4812DRAFT_470562 [Daldinia caldariorum]KAI1468719.1 hypothetical protein F4812DRAFT_470562 [Daldinia caldariorum]
MKLTAGPLFTILALIAYLPSILAVDGLAANRRSVAVSSQELANNGTAAGNDAGAVNSDQNEDNKDGAGQNGKENKDGNDNADEEENANDQKDADKENKDQNNDNNDKNLDEDKLNNGNIKDNLQQNIGKLMLLLGVCNFDLGSIGGIGIGNQIQLLLQLQQLAQLQQLGLVNSSSIEQLLRQELLLKNFNLRIIKRTVDASVKQAARGKGRTIVARKACQNKV